LIRIRLFERAFSGKGWIAGSNPATTPHGAFRQEHETPCRFWAEIAIRSGKRGSAKTSGILAIQGNAKMPCRLAAGK
jgi:hypothetical protein